MPPMRGKDFLSGSYLLVHPRTEFISLFRDLITASSEFIAMKTGRLSHWNLIDWKISSNPFFRSFDECHHL